MHKKHHSHHSGPHGDPDKGPPMLEGAHHFDKGYSADEKHFSPESGKNHDTHDHQRGNHYMELQNKAVVSDTKKMSRQKFNKIA
ncbi:MAG: hypothetical protein Q8898_15640 [Bacillota bacterium]|nr:hypothetical protein [Bacillota bacterium]